jgi:hypothetical protein
MSEDSKSARRWFWFYNLLIPLIAVGVFLAVAVPNFICQFSYYDKNAPSSPIKRSRIFHNLYNIDLSKQFWAREHILGFTNEEQMLQLTNLLTEEDLSRYMMSNPNDKSVFPPIAGEIYTINPLNKPPEARLTRKVETLPKDTILTFTGINTGWPKYIYPSPTQSR